MLANTTVCNLFQMKCTFFSFIISVYLQVTGLISFVAISLNLSNKSQDFMKRISSIDKYCEGSMMGYLSVGRTGFPQIWFSHIQTHRRCKRKHMEAFRAGSFKSPCPPVTPKHHPERALNPVTEVRGPMRGLSTRMESRPPRNKPGSKDKRRTTSSINVSHINNCDLS